MNFCLLSNPLIKTSVRRDDEDPIGMDKVLGILIFNNSFFLPVPLDPERPRVKSIVYNGGRELLRMPHNIGTCCCTLVLFIFTDAED